MKWFAAALLELADRVREVPGPSHHARIVEYHRATTLRATTDEVPWCSSFACWAIEQAGLTSTKSAAARSWLAWGTPMTKPSLGCITVLSRGSNPASGHVGFWCGERGDRVAILGGNQSDAVSVAWFPKVRVLAYRWPWGVTE